jgi:hypothetical protein
MNAATNERTGTLSGSTLTSERTNLTSERANALSGDRAMPPPNERSLEEAMAAASAAEGEIRDFVRRERDPALGRRSRLQAGGTADIDTENITSLIQRVAGSSVAEIDRLIAELQSVRDYLQAESDRVQRETTRFTHLSQTALASVKIITESMGQWKSSAAVPTVENE